MNSRRRKVDRYTVERAQQSVTPWWLDVRSSASVNSSNDASDEAELGMQYTGGSESWDARVHTSKRARFV